MLLTGLEPCAELSGTLTIVTEPGVYRRVPFFSTVTAYKQVVTTTFGDRVGGHDQEQSRPPVTARFADTCTPVCVWSPG